MTITIKQDDTQPAMKVRLKDSAGNPANLTGASVQVAIQHYSRPAVRFLRDAYIADMATGEAWKINDVPDRWRDEVQALLDGEQY